VADQVGDRPSRTARYGELQVVDRDRPEPGGIVPQARQVTRHLHTSTLTQGYDNANLMHTQCDCHEPDHQGCTRHGQSGDGGPSAATAPAAGRGLLDVRGPETLSNEIGCFGIELFGACCADAEHRPHVTVDETSLTETAYGEP
jgi:hypothetical protein